MITDYITYALLCVGCIIILSNFFDSKWIVSKLFAKNTVSSSEGEKNFLKVISLWYQLKEQCDKCNLSVASEKLDGVFPLLNGVLENEKITKY